MTAALSSVLDAAGKLVGGDNHPSLRVRVYKRDGDSLVTIGSSPGGDGRMRAITMPSSLVGHAYSIGRSMVVSDVQAVSDAAFTYSKAKEADQIQSICAVPLADESGSPFAVLSMDSTRKHFFDKRAVELTQSVALLVGPFVRALIDNE